MDKNKELDYRIDSFLYRIRGNNILNWVERLENVNRYKRILSKYTYYSELEVESGVVKMVSENIYIGHKLAKCVKAGFSFTDIMVIMKHEIFEFEDKYGNMTLTDQDIEELKQVIYYSNRNKANNIDINDKKLLIHIENSAEVLYYLLGSTIKLENLTNGWCKLTFTIENKEKEYCTIFSEKQLGILEKVNKEIRGDK